MHTAVYAVGPWAFGADDDEAPAPAAVETADGGVTAEQRAERDAILLEKFGNVPLAEIQEALAAEGYHVGKATRRLKGKAADASSLPSRTLAPTDDKSVPAEPLQVIASQ